MRPDPHERASETKVCENTEHAPGEERGGRPKRGRRAPRARTSLHAAMRALARPRPPAGGRPRPPAPAASPALRTAQGRRLASAATVLAAPAGAPDLATAPASSEALSPPPGDGGEVAEVRWGAGTGGPRAPPRRPGPAAALPVPHSVVASMVTAPAAGGSEATAGGAATARAARARRPPSDAASAPARHPRPPPPPQIHGPEDLEAALAAASDASVVVLMAKSASCRPCKMFQRKYQRLAASTPNTTFLLITGDESKETRGMMMAMAVKVTFFFLFSSRRAHPHPTRAPRRRPAHRPPPPPPPQVTPTFFVYRRGAIVRTATGVNENNLKAAVEEALALP